MIFCLIYRSYPRAVSYLNPIYKNFQLCTCIHDKICPMSKTTVRKDYLKELREGKQIPFTGLCFMIIQLSVPAILAQISTIIMQYIDASMVGSLGAKGSASIGLVASSQWLFGGLTMSLSTGFIVQVAQQIGACDNKKARNIMKQAFVIVTAISLAATAIASSISLHLPVWLGGGSDITRDAGIYFLIFALFLPVHALNGLAGGMLQASGNMKIPGILHIIMCLLDVIFNKFLIFPSVQLFGMTLKGAGLGVIGASLGTEFAKLICCILMLYFLFTRSVALRPVRNEKLTFNAGEIRRAFKIALPVAAEQIIMSGAQILQTRIVAPLGTVSIAANSLSVTAESLCYMPGFGIATAASTIIGQSIGAGRKDLTRKLGFIVTFFGMAVMTLSGILMYIFAPYMLGFLSVDAAVVALGTRVLRIEAFAEPMYAASIVANGVFRGTGDTLMPAVMSLISMWAVRIPIAALLAPVIGLTGVWLGMCIELCFRGALFLIRLYRFQKSPRASAA